ncbi:uncharacterized protein LOC119464016 [Dermacentor silvarum]|uniref:uncharacterized protein LOC119464016 n=1 Tax=Dermacentor silvarum TaxID=543639 RepID=UPI00189A21FC|nr:uncharacterized protein LOC119464016 [Dermacentor silvarum]
MNTHSDIDAPTMSAVELKLPPFWPADTELWFIQVEAQFAARRITADLTRYHRILLNDTDLGDRTPSQLLRHMQRLVGSVTGLDSTLLREIFLQRLPSNVRVLLATVAERDLGKMATIADTIMAAANPSASVANVPVESNEFLEFREEIARLTETVAALQARTSHPLEQRSAQPQQPRLRWCWYHRKHRDAARKCVVPWGYPGNARGQH